MAQPALAQTARSPQGQSTTLTASEIIHGLEYASPSRAARRRSAVRAWLGAGALGGLACWQVVANHFALSRQADSYVSAAVTRWASHNEVINHAVYIAGQTDFMTGGLLVAMLYYCWFDNSTMQARAWLLLGFGAVLTAAVTSRLLQVSLPLRLRPMHAVESGFNPLPGIDPTLANHWGSFPSDHAALLFALAAVVWRQSRWLGLLATASALFGVLPRIYLGLHYLSDVVAGAALGIGLVFMLGQFGPRALAEQGVAWAQRRAGLAYGMAFLLSFEVATLFEDIRQVGRGVPAVLKQFGL